LSVKKVRYKGKVYTYPRNYKKEYSERTEAQKKNRSIRRRARMKVIKNRGEKAVAGKDVHHVRGVRAGNSMKNLRVVSKKTNRSKK
jgi:hypothetical protein